MAMNPWSQQIHLQAPLRDVRLAGPETPARAAEAERQRVWQEGYDKGRIDGEKLVSEQLLKQRGELQEVLQGVLNSMRGAVPQVVRDTEDTVISLAMEVARKLVSDMPISAPMVEAAVRDALGHVEGSTQITVRLHPDDLELVQSAGSALLTSSNAKRDFRFLSSTEVSRGGCLVETRFGTVDSRRETKFDLLKKSLLA
jgi:flagellar assembly protein FliH